MTTVDRRGGLSPAVEVIAISMARREALFDNGIVMPFTVMYDADGDETDCADDARVALARTPGGGCVAIVLHMFTMATVH